MKICRKCDRDFSGKNCEHCARERAKAWKIANPERRKDSQAAYRAANKEKIAASKVEYHKKNAEKIGAKAAAWVKANPQRAAETRREYARSNAEKIAAYQAEYRKLNAEKLAAYRKAYHAVYDVANAEKIRERHRAYHRANPEKARMSCINRRAKKREVGGTLSSGLAEKLKVLQKNLCACCKRKLGADYHMDHIMPLALGGVNEDWNIQLLRAECNLSKSYKHPVDFMQSRGYLL